MLLVLSNTMPQHRSHSTNSVNLAEADQVLAVAQ